MYLVTLRNKKIHQYKITSAENANNVKSENKAHNKADDNMSTVRNKKKMRKLKKKKHKRRRLL